MEEGSAQVRKFISNLLPSASSFFKLFSFILLITAGILFVVSISSSVAPLTVDHQIMTSFSADYQMDLPWIDGTCTSNGLGLWRVAQMALYIWKLLIYGHHLLTFNLLLFVFSAFFSVAAVFAFHREILHLCAYFSSLVLQSCMPTRLWTLVSPSDTDGRRVASVALSLTRLLHVFPFAVACIVGASASIFDCASHALPHLTRSLTSTLGIDHAALPTVG